MQPTTAAILTEALMEVTAKSEFPGDIGSQLAKLRTADKMSQSDIAPKIRVDQSRISRLEKVK